MRPDDWFRIRSLGGLSLEYLRAYVFLWFPAEALVDDVESWLKSQDPNVRQSTIRIILHLHCYDEVVAGWRMDYVVTGDLLLCNN
jgi:hypothetical protein